MDKIAFDLAARYPDLPSAVVIIDGPTFVPAEVGAAFQAVLEGFRSPAYKEAIRQLAEQAIFLPNDNSERKRRIINDLTANPQHVIVSTWENYLAYDVTPAIAACKTPLLFIQSHFPANVDRLRELCPQVVVEHTTGAGYFSQLEAPEQVNAIIERFLFTVLSPELPRVGVL
jgi:pimeloyl-ACP methyl ester carboxylesterase